MTNTSRATPAVPSTRVVDVHAHAVPLDLLTVMRSRRGPSPLPELGGDATAVRAVAGGRPLTSADRAALLGGNASRLFGC